jgi:hypothetical protein
MSFDNKVLIVFQSTHHVLKSEEYLKNHGIQFKTRFAPREISSECGLVLMIDAEDCAKSGNIIMQEAQINVIKFYRNIEGRWVPIEEEKI